MENKGYPAFINTMTAKDKKKWYRVRVGTFNSLETAEKYGESLKVLEPEVKVVFITQNN
jgi:cell division protein FtsN